MWIRWAGRAALLRDAAGIKQAYEDTNMIELAYSLVIEATEEPDCFGFSSSDLEGFTGIGHSVEDCSYKAKWGVKEHVSLLAEQGLPVPPRNPDPKIIIQNERKVAVF